MVRILLLFVLLSVSFSASAQEWVKKLNDPNCNIIETSKLFNEYWKNKEIQKGKGFKAFKRMEYMLFQRSYPSGKKNDPTLAWNETLKFRSLYSGTGKANRTAAANWTSLGPSSWQTTSYNPGNGRVNGITVDPLDHNIIYTGTPSGGLWKSIDCGNTWTCLTDDLPIIGTSCIAIHPTNTDTLYIATGDGDASDNYSLGVLKSYDGGLTWNNTGLSWTIYQYHSLRTIIMDPTNPNILLVAADNGVYRSDDAGDTWTNTLSGWFKDLEFMPNNPQVVYASGNTFWKSTDGGLTFTQITSGVPQQSDVSRIAIAVTPADSNYVYMMVGSAATQGLYGIYKSTDAGLNFTLQTNSPNLMGYAMDGSDGGGQAWYDIAIAASPNNAEEIFTGGVNVWKSTDGGQNFTISSHWVYDTNSSVGYTHADIHFLAFYGDSLYCGSDGGIFRTPDFGSTWDNLSFGITNAQFYRMGGSYTDADLIYAGAQDNGSNRLDNTQWTHVLGADGMETLVDYSNSNTVYCTTQSGGLNRSTDGGQSFSYIAGDITESGGWVTPFVIHPTDPQILYAGYENIWGTLNQGGNWSSLAPFPTTGYNVNALALAQSDPNYIYASRWNDLWQSTDGGATWNDISVGLPFSYAGLTYIAISPTDPLKAWVTFSGFSQGEKVYKTNDGGLTWTNVSYNLPNLPCNTIIYQAGTPDGMYVGCDVGIFYIDSTLTNWVPFYDDLPNVIVDELEIHYPTSKIRAATFGRGIWESDLYTTSNVLPIVNFTASNTQICPGESITFTDLSLYAVPGWTWYFPGGTPSFSTAQQPVVTYSTTGIYPVKLIVSNNFGTDSLEIVNYITVGYPTPVSVPASQDFENVSNIPVDWKVENPTGGITWNLNTGVGGYSLSAQSVYIDNYNYGNYHALDYLVSPDYDLSSNLSGYQLSFDLAYAAYPGYYDTLRVYGSTDCGMTKSMLFEAGGNDLATAPEDGNPFVPTSAQWYTVMLPLNQFVGFSNVRFYFENKTEYGNNLYLDNINIPVTVNVDEANSLKRVILSPNPANNKVVLSGLPEKSLSIVLTDLSGKLMMEKQTLSTNEFMIDISDLPAGYYLVRIKGSTSETRKLIKM